ncbi:hypothetical protein M2334_001383 [Sphingobium sp. B11D3D]|nr:hypothetical protein [Sphingobium sp. B11D3D]
MPNVGEDLRAAIYPAGRRKRGHLAFRLGCDTCGVPTDRLYAQPTRALILPEGRHFRPTIIALSFRVTPHAMGNRLAS